MQKKGIEGSKAKSLRAFKLLNPESVLCPPRPSGFATFSSIPPSFWICNPDGLNIRICNPHLVALSNSL